MVMDLAAGGYGTVTRAGSRNRYEINTAAPLRGPLVGGLTVRHLVALCRGGKS